MKGKRCYFDNDSCDYEEGLWQCETCEEWFCYTHSHYTDRGTCCECTGCEYLRKERQEEKHDKSQ